MIAGVPDQATGRQMVPVTPGRDAVAALAFFRLVWPAVGTFCLAVRRPMRSGDGSWWDHETFTCHQAAALRAVELAASLDVYFAVGTLRKPCVWDAAKKGGKGGWSFRKQTNIDRLRCIFLDLDVGDDKPFASQREAGEALARFLRRSGLPWPRVVDSGYGLHVYWVLNEALPAVDWHAFAVKFHARVAAGGLKVDPARTLDRASVLRVPGTLNHKHGARRAVRMMTPNEPGGWSAS